MRNCSPLRGLASTTPRRWSAPPRCGPSRVSRAPPRPPANARAGCQGRAIRWSARSGSGSRLHRYARNDTCSHCEERRSNLAGLEAGGAAAAEAAGPAEIELGAVDLDVDLQERGVALLAEVDADHVVADLDKAADDGQQFALQDRQEIRRVAARALMRQDDL